MNFACSIDVSVAPMDLLNDGSMKIGSVGDGDSTGIFSPRGDGDGKEMLPASISGDGGGEISSPRGAGMGSHSPTGNSPLPSLQLTAAPRGPASSTAPPILEGEREGEREREREREREGERERDVRLRKMRGRKRWEQERREMRHGERGGRYFFLGT
jgi:hypothetical protein